MDELDDEFDCCVPEIEIAERGNKGGCESSGECRSDCNEVPKSGRA
jgi:hypothetical protein